MNLAPKGPLDSEGIKTQNGLANKTKKTTQTVLRLDLANDKKQST